MSRINLQKVLGTSPPTIKTGKLIWTGYFVLILFFGGLIGWSLYTTIDAAAIANGKIAINDKLKTIQHLDGGIIKKIYVRDGDTVKKNDQLIQLDPTQAQITLGVISKQIDEMAALENRLIAEKNNIDQIKFDKRLINKKAQIETRELIRSQQQIFEAKQRMFNGQLEILQYKITQLQNEIKSFTAQRQSTAKQLLLIQEELDAMHILARKNLVEKPKILALKREKARLNGAQGEYLGRIAKANQQIAETRSRILTLQQERQQKILSELRETQQKKAELIEKERAHIDLLKRLTIRSPIQGTIVNLKHHTETGGVISPGQPILDIVPTQSKLIIEARINPLDIDVVHNGLKAKIQLTALKQKSLPNIEGIVRHVSADIQKDQSTQESYYLVTIDGFQHHIEGIDSALLYPGMPVQVMIITDNRSPLAYLLAPLRDSLKRAFREN
jgi:HlyD family secretion protein/epimerase transport system membrane fusion protein